MIILAFLILLLMIFQPQSGWLLIPLAALYLMILVMGSVNIRSGFYLRALCKGKTQEKVIALTFDDGPDAKITPMILNILERQQVPATFFLIGHKAEKQVDLVHLIISKGHLAGIHSYSHDFCFDFFRRGKMEQDLLRSEGIIMKESGKRPLLFRPPYGVTNPALAKVVKKLGYSVIGWSVRSLDTSIKDAEKVSKRILGKLHPGGVILMHDTQNITPEALEKVIIMAKEEGYRFAGLDELLGIEAYKN